MEAETPDQGVLGSEDGPVFTDSQGHVIYPAVGRGDEHVVEPILVGIALHQAGEGVRDRVGVRPVTAHAPA